MKDEGADITDSLAEEEAIAVIKTISLIDHKSTEMEKLFDLLYYNSSACAKEIRKAARLKMSLILRFLPSEQREKCLTRLIEELKTCKDSWLERNILESIYPHVDNAALADIIPHLDSRVQETFEKLYKGQNSPDKEGGLLQSVSQRCLEWSRGRRG